MGRWTDRKTDRQTDKSNFIGYCLTNAKHQNYISKDFLKKTKAILTIKQKNDLPLTTLQTEKKLKLMLKK